jgi:3-oxoadipate enol-lactonase
MLSAPLLYCRIDGLGPRLVLLHPVGLDLTCFDPLVPLLSDRFQVLRPDARGHGRSPEAPAGWTLRDYAADVHALLESMGSAPAVIVGFSFGGMVAQELALAYATDVAALVLGGCPATLSEQARRTMAERGELAERQGMAAVVEETLARWFTDRFRESGGAEPARQRLLAGSVAGWAAAWRAISGLDTAARLPRISVPTLCLAGDADRSVPPGVLEDLAGQIPNSRFVVLHEAPHMFFIEQPRATASAIAAFVEA